MSTTTNASYAITEGMKERVITALDRMGTIAKADMMKQVGYIGDDIVNPRRRNAVCGGRKACAIGSLWLAAGVSLRVHPGFVELPGVTQSQRDQFVARKPVLRHALHFLNEAADEYMRANSIRPNASMWRDSVEGLFESPSRKLQGDGRRKAMLKVISAAKRKVRAA